MLQGEHLKRKASPSVKRRRALHRGPEMAFPRPAIGQEMEMEQGEEIKQLIQIAPRIDTQHGISSDESANFEVLEDFGNRTARSYSGFLDDFIARQAIPVLAQTSDNFDVIL